MNPTIKKLFLGIGALVLSSGLILAYLEFFGQPISEFSILRHPYEEWYLKTHFLLSVVFTFVLGMLTASHIFQRWKSQTPGRKTGKILTFLLPIMVFSGFVLPILTEEAMQKAILWVHIASNLLFVLVFLCHQIKVRSSFPWVVVWGLVGVVGISYFLARFSF